eukprot:1990683-Pyramimonas_sp.AAC.1
MMWGSSKKDGQCDANIGDYCITNVMINMLGMSRTLYCPTSHESQLHGTIIILLTPNESHRGTTQLAVQLRRDCGTLGM